MALGLRAPSAVTLFIALGVHAAITPAALCAGDPFADTIVSFEMGRGGNPAYADPATVLGPPERYTGEGAFPGVVSPFNPPFGTDEIVSIGAGGSLVVAFDAPIGDDPGNLFGIDLLVFGNAFFVDAAFPAGVVGFLFGAGGGIDVSADGRTWVAVGGAMASGLFPTLGFLDSGPYALDPGRVPSDFTRPVDPSLDLETLRGVPFAQLVDLYGGSGGGAGIDLAGTGLSEISFVRITNAPDAPGSIAMDAISDVAPQVPGDATGDGAVNVEDLVAVITSWGPVPAGAPADLNGDGLVDVQDLVVVITSWS